MFMRSQLALGLVDRSLLTKQFLGNNPAVTALQTQPF
jgi:hypothetical protein